MAKEKVDDSKVIDNTLGVDYTHLLNRSAFDTVIVSPEEIAAEDNELVRSFLSANADIKPYIDKAIFDPAGAVARHIINLCKNPDFMVKIGETEYRLPQAIMIKAMSDCYSYVQGVAQALAEKSGNSSCIQLSDQNVYEIAENYFKLGGKRAEIKITNENKKVEKKKPHAIPKKEEKKAIDNDLPIEITDDEPSEPSTSEESKFTQMTFFDL